LLIGLLGQGRRSDENQDQEEGCGFVHGFFE